MEDYILSYPRSGNTWTRYCIEFLTERPTVGIADSLSRLKMPILFSSYENCVFRKSHYLDINPNKLLFLIRNFKECIPRHLHVNSLSPTAIKGINDYLNLLRLYDEHDKEKMIVYYEDMISGDEDFFLEFTEFIGGTEERLDEFLSNIDEHRERGVQIYINRGEYSVTEGKKEIHHSKELNTDLWDQKALEIDRELAEKYLSRYIDEL